MDTIKSCAWRLEECEGERMKNRGLKQYCFENKNFLCVVAL